MAINGGRSGSGGSSGGKARSDAIDEGPERMSPLPLENTENEKRFLGTNINCICLKQFKMKRMKTRMTCRNKNDVKSCGGKATNIFQ